MIKQIVNFREYPAEISIDGESFINEESAGLPLALNRNK